MATKPTSEKFAKAASELHTIITRAIDMRVAEHQQVQRDLIGRLDKTTQRLSAAEKQIADLYRKASK